MIPSLPARRSEAKAADRSVIRTGASGTTAAAQVARAAPDGYTLMVIPSGHPTAAAPFARLPFRAVADFTMITLASIYPYVMSVPSTTSVNSVAELVKLGRTRAILLTFGTPGTGSGPQLAIELLALQTKMKVQHIPFRGSAHMAGGLTSAFRRLFRSGSKAIVVLHNEFCGVAFKP